MPILKLIKKTEVNSNNLVITFRSPKVANLFQILAKTGDSDKNTVTFNLKDYNKEQLISVITYLGAK